MSENKTPTVYLGFITFGALTAPYLSTFLDSLAKQTFQDFKVVIYDNTPTDNLEHLKDLPASVEVFRSGVNLGFSKAYNKLITEAIKAGAKYFFVINPDTLLEPKVLELLVEALTKDEALASVSPKLLSWDFEKKLLTNLIDSCGLVLHSGLGFSDLGQGEKDVAQYDKAIIMGSTGAAGLYSLKALEKVAENNNYFDANFFMYKEDCDLAYRLYLQGFKTKLVPEAIVYHDRTVTGGTVWQRFVKRRTRSKDAKRWSFTNQHFLFIKYWSKQNLFNRLMILIRLKLLFLNALIFEPYLLACYRTIFIQAKNLKRY